MSIRPEDALKRRREALDRSLAIHRDAEVRFVLSLQTGRFPPLKSTPLPSGRWGWDTLFAMYARNTGRYLKLYDYRDWPAGGHSLWWAVYATRGGDPVAADFIQQSQILAGIAGRILGEHPLAGRRWFIDELGCWPLVSLCEVGWFSLVCRLLKRDEDAGAFHFGYKVDFDPGIDGANPIGHEALRHFLESLERVEAGLPAGNYAVWPTSDARQASIDAIDMLLRHCEETLHPVNATGAVLDASELTKRGYVPITVKEAGEEFDVSVGDADGTGRRAINAAKILDY